MKTNLKLNDDEVLKLFRQQVMSDKTDVLNNVHWQVESLKEELPEADKARAPF